jgi:DNA-binding NarL/FixJ family response regulator
MGAPTVMSARSTTAGSTTATAPGGPTRSVRVVIVDDRFERRQLMSHVIGLGGDEFSVVGYAEDAAGAAEAVDRLDASAVVVEIQIPVAVGLETIAALRHGHPELRIVVCSFHDTKATREQALALGADGYVTKPFSPRDVYSLLVAPA